MKLKTFIALFSILGFMACYSKQEPKKPENLISKEKMVDILIDSKLIGASSSVEKRIMKEHGIDITTFVYKKHNIDSTQFALSNNYYAFHVEEYKAIYEKVKDSLEALKEAFKKQEAAEWKNATKKEEDSIIAIQATKDSIAFSEKVDKSKTTLNKDSILSAKLKKDLRPNPDKVKLITPASSK
ncbi:hypothetical protein PW52_02530 [Tamlana sedimentorum]|uniref:DUF4296 domain-containing protein n=1 Tax=Neotamlana sedimentorum TaxID=1435349 RepID=A0A0D7WFM6_9FLAO|nr:DUF4296 domain-containing protein [Tamlana sedimentorum]KJD36547.1 hypothetical protein PW52_02530 [Tamlana sedimentorum]